MQLPEKLARVPYSFARQHGVCIKAEENGATILYLQTLQPGILSEIRRYIGMPLPCREVVADEFERALALSYQHESGSAQQFANDADAAISLENAVDYVVGTGDLLAQEDDAPIIRLINALLMEAARENASDIHVETYEKQLVVRFRIDGHMRDMLTLRPSLAPLLVSRIKVMARLDIAEKRIPQDGRISVLIGGQSIDVRVSTIPTGGGERVVLRLLDKQAGRISLEQLGLSSADKETVGDLIAKPHGIILITGPTGSGKTTTLYAMLSRLNDRSRNILTVEDPIEYQIEGIGQTQVNTKIDMTFARGLRAILRQDPDVVMIGEIRDAETARIAVQASITGHLVLSTLHTNSAIGAVTRLVDMGVEPFLLSSSLIGLIAQRLVRALCAECRLSYSAGRAECDLLGLDENTLIYKATGCKTCRGTGYKGRVAIYELLPIDETARELIHNGAGESALLRHLRQTHAGILEDGRDKVRAGITTVEEIMRVTGD